MDDYDSFITHRNQKRDLEKLLTIGEEAYIEEQKEKRQILDRLSADYNDGGWITRARSPWEAISPAP